MLTDYKIIKLLGEGTFSTVHKVEHLLNGKKYAMKRFKKTYKTMNEVNACSEIKILRKLNPHKHIVNMYEVIYEHTEGLLCLTFELMECNLYELLSRENYTITESMAKEYTFQICTALEYIHSLGIFHRDIKPENILINKDIIKLADFGSCRPINSEAPFTEYIATRWYRSPECILAEGLYNYKMDMWAVGCVIGEMLSKEALFPGADEFDQIEKIHDILGTPSNNTIRKMLTEKGISIKIEFRTQKGKGLEALLPNVSRQCLSFMKALLSYNPEERISAAEALSHPFLSNRPTRITSARAAKLQKTQRTIATLPHINTLNLGASANTVRILANTEITQPAQFANIIPVKHVKKPQNPHYFTNALPPIPLDKPDMLEKLFKPLFNVFQPAASTVIDSSPRRIPHVHVATKKMNGKKQTTKDPVPLKKKLSLPKIQGHATVYGKSLKEENSKHYWNHAFFDPFSKGS